MKWYIVFGTFVLCRPGTQEPMPFDAQDHCQAYIDQHCNPSEFPEVEFIQATNPEAVLDYARNRPNDDQAEA
jgi:hypothetical protein